MSLETCYALFACANGYCKIAFSPSSLNSSFLSQIAVHPHPYPRPQAHRFRRLHPHHLGRTTAYYASFPLVSLLHTMQFFVAALHLSASLSMVMWAAHLHLHLKIEHHIKTCGLGLLGRCSPKYHIIWLSLGSEVSCIWFDTALHPRLRLPRALLLLLRHPLPWMLLPLSSHYRGHLISPCSFVSALTLVGLSMHVCLTVGMQILPKDNPRCFCLRMSRLPDGQNHRFCLSGAISEHRIKIII